MTSDIWERFLLSDEIRSSVARLRQSKVLLIGNGALGSDIATRIAGCNVSRITLVDGDKVSEANIPHSVIFRMGDVGSPKVEVVAEFLSDKFDNLEIIKQTKFIQQCDQTVFLDHDLVICAPDNDQTRIWVNYYCVKNKIPAIFAGVGGPRSEWMGYIFLYKPNIGACFNCFAIGGQHPTETGVFLGKTDTTNDFDLDRKKCGGENVPVPMIAPIIGVIAGYAATTALRVLLGFSDIHSYTYINLRKPNLMTTQIIPIPSCAVCGNLAEFDISDQLEKR